MHAAFHVEEAFKAGAEENGQKLAKFRRSDAGAKMAVLAGVVIVNVQDLDLIYDHLEVLHVASFADLEICVSEIPARADQRRIHALDQLDVILHLPGKEGRKNVFNCDANAVFFRRFKMSF